MKIIVTGDLHCQWFWLQELIKQQKPDVVLCCGDFGYWPEVVPHKLRPKNIKTFGAKVYFCDGNHEHHWQLKELINNEIAENVFYMKRGTILELDGKTIMFMGGAHSIDKCVRTLGKDWFPEELITQQDVMNLNPNLKVDIMITHTCPNEFGVQGTLGFTEKDSSQDALSYLLEAYKPAEWYFAHFHKAHAGKHNNCNWICLDMAPNTTWWKELGDTAIKQSAVKIEY